MTNQALADTIRAEAAKRAEREIAEANTRASIAALFDAAGFTECLPDFVHAYGPRGLYGAIGSLSFKDIAPDAAVRLLAAFPPMDCARYRDGNTSTVCPIDKAGERYTWADDSDGVLLRLDGGHGYGQRVKVEWWTTLGGTCLHIEAELCGPYLPRIVPGRTVTVAGEFIRYEGTDSVQWGPIDAPPGPFTRYARGSGNALQNFVFFNGVRDWLARVADKLDEEARETQASYERASRNMEAPRQARPDEIEAHRAAYEGASLRPGTLLQAATLATDTATAAEAIARAHWRVFCRVHGIATRYNYFDWHAFACWYLKAAGCHVDGGYTYGSAWL